MADRSKEDISRRAFFGATAKGAAVGLGAVVAATGSAQAAEGDAPEGAHYRETSHVKTYYGSAKF